MVCGAAGAPCCGGPVVARQSGVGRMGMATQVGNGAASIGAWGGDEWIGSLSERRVQE